MKKKSLEAEIEMSMDCWIGNFTISEVKVLGDTLLCTADSKRTGQQSLLPEECGGRRRLPAIGGSDVRLAHQLPRKPVAVAEGSM